MCPESRQFAEVTFKLDYLHKEGLPSLLSGIAPLLQFLGASHDGHRPDEVYGAVMEQLAVAWEGVRYSDG